MSNDTTYSGQCFCGTVQFTVRGRPEAMGYCHCVSCRQWSASPLNAFTLWTPEAVQVTRGDACIGIYNKTAHSARKWCTACGGHLFTEHPAWSLVDIYAAVVPDLAFKPEIHVHYQERVLSMTDGLPKFKDLPAEMGGSGIQVPE